MGGQLFLAALDLLKTQADLWKEKVDEREEGQAGRAVNGAVNDVSKYNHLIKLTIFIKLDLYSVLIEILK